MSSGKVVKNVRRIVLKSPVFIGGFQSDRVAGSQFSGRDFLFELEVRSLATMPCKMVERLARKSLHIGEVPF